MGKQTDRLVRPMCVQIFRQMNKQTDRKKADGLMDRETTKKEKLKAGF